MTMVVKVMVVTRREWWSAKQRGRQQRSHWASRANVPARRGRRQQQGRGPQRGQKRVAVQVGTSKLPLKVPRQAGGTVDDLCRTISRAMHRGDETVELSCDGYKLHPTFSIDLLDTDSVDIVATFASEAAPPPVPIGASTGKVKWDNPAYPEAELPIAQISPAPVGRRSASR